MWATAAALLRALGASKRIVSVILAAVDDLSGVKVILSLWTPGFCFAGSFSLKPKCPGRGFS